MNEVIKGVPKQNATYTPNTKQKQKKNCPP